MCNCTVYALKCSVAYHLADYQEIYLEMQMAKKDAMARLPNIILIDGVSLNVDEEVERQKEMAMAKKQSQFGKHSKIFSSVFTNTMMDYVHKGEKVDLSCKKDDHPVEFHRLLAARVHDGMQNPKLYGDQTIKQVLRRDIGGMTTHLTNGSTVEDEKEKSSKRKNIDVQK